jgi:hypothetical protein
VQSILTTASWAHATHLGADFVINAKTGDPAAAVKKATGGGAHGVLITAPSLIAFKQGVGMTRKRGTCVLVGLPPGEFPVPLFDVVANCITLRGSFVGTRQDMAEALSFAIGGKVKADIELRPCLRSTKSSSALSTANALTAKFVKLVQEPVGLPWTTVNTAIRYVLEKRETPKAQFNVDFGRQFFLIGFGDSDFSLSHPVTGRFGMQRIVYPWELSQTRKRLGGM